MKKLKLTKLQWVLIILFTIFLLADLGTTLMNGDLVQHLETNPLFLLTGSLIPIVIFNVVFLMFLIWYYGRSKINSRFFVVNYIVWLTFLRVFFIINALSNVADPPTIEQAASITSEVKTIYLATYIIFFFILPLILTQLTYFLFKIDHKIEKKGA